jgi:galactose mutarotase-like enzyme
VIFAVAEKEGSRITLTYSSNEETKKIYPFDFLLIASYELRGSELKFTFNVTNKSKVPMPYMFGWHPGFALPCGGGVDIESYKLDLGVGELNWIPLQNGPFACPVSKKYAIPDGCYHFNEKEIYSNDTMIFTGHKNSLVMSAEGSSYSLDMKWSDNLPFLCIWKDEYNAAKFVCLEPWSSLPADGVTPENFNEREMRRLPAGATEEFFYTLSFKH